jgi:hypothetical protein
VTPVLSISETDIMPASYANTSYANILFQLMPTLCTMLAASGHSSAYIFSSDCTARKARMTYLNADSIVPLDHRQLSVVKLCLSFSSFCTSRTTSFLKWLPQSDIQNSTTPNNANHGISASTVAAASAVRHGTSHRYTLKSSLRSSRN